MICDTRASRSSITPSIMSRAAPSSRPSRRASSTTCLTSSSTVGSSVVPARRPKVLARSVAIFETPPTNGVTIATNGRHSGQVATRILGPSVRARSIGAATRRNQTIPIQRSITGRRIRPGTSWRSSERAATSVAAVAATTTMVAAMNATGSLPSKISSANPGVPRSRQISWTR